VPGCLNPLLESLSQAAVRITTSAHHAVCLDGRIVKPPFVSVSE